ncbi:unnamed protein product [Symbiodinium natans]|uniref:Uncharacterized protein n=1 Tax=Symbiodinium natans TaxID=878477 RepID=A0A812PV24_9DINO|nr:unnamed protein product [Symbiodinium natans]
MASVPDFCEALQARSAELRRKVHEERQKQEAAQRDLASVEDEVAQLRKEALELQLAADQQRQERKAQREAKVDVASLKKEVSRRQTQVRILTEELARTQADVHRLVDEAVARAEKAALQQEVDMEKQWSARKEAEHEKLRQTEEKTLHQQEESARLEHEIRVLPPRTAVVQLFAVLDELRHVRQVAASVQSCRKEEEQLRELRRRRLCEKGEKLVQLDRDAAEQRCQAAELQAAFEEEARLEEAELTERLERNRKRAERTEREASRHLKELRDAARPEPNEARGASTSLPPVAPGSRSAVHAEFALVGALKALDQELGSQRFGLRQNLRATGL